MLLIDYREGSAALVAPLSAMGLPVEETTLEFGDIAFTGRGERGKPLEIGIEFKTLSEFVGSLRTERLTGHQLPGMRAAYDVSYLLVEGEVLFDTTGRLLQKAKWGKRCTKPLPGGMGVSEYYKRVIGLHLRGGLNYVNTHSRPETLKFIEALYRTWTDKDFDEHDSHLGIYLAPTVVPLSDERQALCRYPGVGTQVSKAALERFKTVRRAANGTVAEWAELQTVDRAGKSRRFGEKSAQKVVDFLEGR